MKQKIEKMIRGIDKKYILFKLFISFIFAMTIMLDSLIVFDGNIFSNIEELYFKQLQFENIIILLTTMVATYLFISIIEYIVDKIESKICLKERKNISNIKVFFIALLIIIICWMPTILTYFPGGIFVDTQNSIAQILKIERLSNHHPILYTAIIGIFIKISEKISTGYPLQLAMELFTIFQVLAMAGAFAYFICWLQKRRISIKLLIVITVFFGTFKLFPIYAVSIWKDTPFCIAMFLYTINIASIIFSKSKKIQKNKGIIEYIILSILVVFLRNNGIYIVTITTIILALVYRKEVLNKLKKFTIIMTLSLISMFIIQGPIYEHFKLNDDYVENFGVMLQQICYVVASDGNMSEDQKELINEFCRIETIKEKYRPLIVDTIKWDKDFNNNYLKNNKDKFIKLWLELLVQNPDQYIEAYLLNTCGYWNVNKTTFHGYTSQTMWGDTDIGAGVKQNDYIEKIFNYSLKNIVSPRTIISSAVFLFIMLLGVTITFYKKRYNNLLIYIPSLVNWLTIMIAAPIAFSLRYVYILVMMIPFSLIIPFLKIDEE